LLGDICAAGDYPLLCNSSHRELSATLESHNDSNLTPTSAGPIRKVAFAALKRKDYRWFLIATMLAMMADNIDRVISYWVFKNFSRRCWVASCQRSTS